MKTILGLLRRSRHSIRRILEAAGSPLLLAALGIVRLYRPSFHQTSPWIYRLADRVGVYPVLDHYHEPLVTPSRLDRQRLLKARHLAGVDLRSDEQLSLLQHLGDYREDLAKSLESGSKHRRPTFDNLAFSPGDAELLYAMVRHFRPKRIVEVGSGHSTRFAVAAVDANRNQGSLGDITCIEPFESPWLEDLGVSVIREPVEQVDSAVFSSLHEDDILFIDSSHVVRPQGDVLYLLNDVLPALPRGVLIHIHDIFTPRDYPFEWLQRRWFWTEQYIVEALLRHNPNLRVVLAVNHLYHDFPDDLRAACPVQATQWDRVPASMWLRVVHTTYE